MGALDRIRSNENIGTSNRRYVTEETPSLEEISDPETLDDERTTSWREWAGENTLLVVVLLVFGALGLVVVYHLIGQFAPDVPGTLWSRRGVVGALTGVGLGFVLGGRSVLNKVLHWSELVIYGGEGAKRYYGYYFESDLGTYSLFVPVAGFSFLGQRSSLYRVADISRQIIRKRGAPWQEDDPVVMRLHPDFTHITHTDFGTVVVTRADGFEVDDQGKESNLRPIAPAEGSKKDMRKMRDTLERTIAEKRHYEELADKYQRQVDDVLENMDRPINERLEEFVDFHERASEASYGRRRRNRRESNGDTGSDVPHGPDPDIESELEESDDDE